MLKGLAPRVSQEYILYRETSVVMENKGVGIMSATDWMTGRE